MNEYQGNLDAISLSTESTLKDAIKSIDNGAIQLCLVLDNQKVVGCITDGDIRRGLLNRCHMDSPVTDFMNKDFLYLTEDDSWDSALRLMKRHLIHHIPVLTNDKELVRIFLFDALLTENVMPNSVVIMAGGEGKRLRPLTDNCPKPMLMVDGKPILERIVEKCISFGFRNFFFSVNYLKEQINEYFQDGAAWGVKIDYLEESEPLGTAGPLSLMPRAVDGPLLVLNGDLLTSVDLIKLINLHKQQSSLFTIATRQFSTNIPFGVVNTSGFEVLGIEEKPEIKHNVNAGIYVIDTDVLEFVPKNKFFDMPDLIELLLINKKRVLAFPIHENWLDVGLPESLRLAHKFVSE